MISYIVLEPLVPCCDICVLKKAANGDAELMLEEDDLMVFYGQITPRQASAALANDAETREGVESGNEDQGNKNTVLKANKQACRPGPRQKERLEACRNALTAWQHKTWQKDFKDCIWGPNVLLPETVLTKLASRTRIQTLDDIKEEIPDWIWADEYGNAILKLLKPIDRLWHEDHERQKAENKAK
jgi:hypothetical protein